jgi:hypothetical protein
MDRHSNMNSPDESLTKDEALVYWSEAWENGRTRREIEPIMRTAEEQGRLVEIAKLRAEMALAIDTIMGTDLKKVELEHVKAYWVVDILRVDIKGLSDLRRHR